MSQTLVLRAAILFTVAIVAAYIIWFKLQKKFGHIPSGRVEFFRTESNQQFTGTEDGRISNIDQIQALLAEADESQRVPLRKRTVIWEWESGDDKGA